MKSFTFISSVILVTVLSLLSASCSFFKNTEPGSIFLITLDTTRADYFDYSLENNTLTPNFARLAAQGTYFDNAYALIPITLPSHASMFFSRPPHQLKILNNGQTTKIPYPSLTQLLKGRGFRTGAVISLGVLKSDFGLAKGFDSYNETFKPYLWEKSAQDVNRDAFALIEETLKKKEKTEKTFFWIHYSDPHEPYFPPGCDGHFTVSLNQSRVFQCLSTEQATVKVEITLEPGENILDLAGTIPQAFSRFPNCKVEYFKYRDFEIRALDRDGKNTEKSALIEIQPPEHLTSKIDRHAVSYYSPQPQSRLTVVNNGTEKITARLSFMYSMNMNDTARKVFYREEIRHMDGEFGKLVAFLKEKNLYDDATFIVMGDHAEGLGEYRNHYGHIHYLNKVFSRVPMILSGVGVKNEGKRSEPVSNLNIAPTILELAKIAKPEFMLGQSLLQPLESKKILLETYAPESYFDAFSLIDYPWQIVFYPGRRERKLEFFNLDNDPFGTLDLNDINNLTEEAQKEEARKIKSQLVNSILKISRIITATKGKVGRSSKRHREILKSLGYL